MRAIIIYCSRFISMEKTSTFYGLKLLFVVWIVFYHCGLEHFKMTNDAVMIFFVLSGFCYRLKEKYFSYISRKVIYIFSTFYVCVLVYAALEWINGIPQELHFNMVKYILLIQSWIPSCNNNIIFAYYSVSWFLSALLLCYLFAQIIAKFISNIKAFYALIFIAVIIMANNYIPVKDEYKSWFTYFNPYIRVFQFASGYALYRVVNDIELRDSNKYLDILLFFAYILSLKYNLFGSFEILIHLAFVCYLYVYRTELLYAILGNKLIRSISKYQIFIYLLHVPFFLFLQRCFTLHKFYLAIISVILSFMVGYIWTTFAEKYCPILLGKFHKK